MINAKPLVVPMFSPSRRTYWRSFENKRNARRTSSRVDHWDGQRLGIFTYSCRGIASWCRRNRAGFRSMIETRKPMLLIFSSLNLPTTRRRLSAFTCHRSTRRTWRCRCWKT